MSMVKRFIALCMNICFVLILVSESAFAFGYDGNVLLQGYREQLSPEILYETVDDNIPVRAGAYQEADIVERWSSDLFFKGDLVTSTHSGLTWVRVKMQDGTYAFVFPDHVQEHYHSFITIANYCDDKVNDPECRSELQVCKCGQTRTRRWTGDVYSSCDMGDVLCQWASGEENAKTEFLDLTADFAIDAGISVTCNPDTIAATGGYAGIACAALIATKGVRTALNTADDLQEGNTLGLAYDAADIVTFSVGDLLKLAELNHAVKHTNLYITLSNVSKNSKMYNRISEMSEYGDLLDLAGADVNLLEEILREIDEEDGRTLRPVEIKMCPAR